QVFRYPTVTARKVIRENVEHTMLVGERETTSTLMKELLAPSLITRRSHWWIWPLAIFLAGVIFLGLYFSMDGNDHSTGNRHKITPANPPSGFTLQR
ncbi:MAG TPA: hypothetical protein VGC95_12225, partial [Chitinophagaceae bacterium]